MYDRNCAVTCIIIAYCTIFIISAFPSSVDENTCIKKDFLDNSLVKRRPAKMSSKHEKLMLFGIYLSETSIIAYEKLKPEMEIIIPDNLPDAPKITPIDIYLMLFFST